jgi:anti-sigma B factor antagonist
MGSTMPSMTGSTAFFMISQHAVERHARAVVVEGELDLATAPSLKRTLSDILRSGCKQIVVDLSQVTFMDSTALGVLIGVDRSLDVGAQLAIVCTNANVLRIFEFAGLDGTFAIFSTFDEALAHVQRSPDASG